MSLPALATQRLHDQIANPRTATTVSGQQLFEQLELFFGEKDLDAMGVVAAKRSATAWFGPSLRHVKTMSDLRGDVKLMTYEARVEFCPPAYYYFDG